MADRVSDRCELHPNGRNVGLAIAQNDGIRLASRVAGHRFVLLMDQDSSPEPTMVARLLDALRGAVRSGTPSRCRAAWIDRHSGQPAPFVKLGWFAHAATDLLGRRHTSSATRWSHLAA